MCVVSLVITGAQDQWGPIKNWPIPVAQDLSEIINRLSAIEKKIGIKDCSDPVKDEFLEMLHKHFKPLSP
jgi:hypothetical protein